MTARDRARRQHLAQQRDASQHTLSMMARVSFRLSAPGTQSSWLAARENEERAIAAAAAPRLPQDESPEGRKARREALAAAQKLYGTALRTPRARRVAKLPEREAFSPSYRDTQRQAYARLAANEQAFRKLGRKKFETREDYATAFVSIRRPAIAATYRRDETFARQRLAGANPLHLVNAATLDRPLSARLPLDDAMFQAVLAAGSSRKRSRRDTTVRRALAQGRLYVADYAITQDVALKPGQFVGAPIAVFHADPERGDRLVPIAIQLGQVPTQSLLLTPRDGSDWEVAKLVVQAADLCVHELMRHLGQTHVAIEGFALATARELAEQHPLRVLLRPHFEFTMAINAFADQVLTSPGGAIETLLPGTRPSSLGLINRAVAELYDGFADFALPKSLARRGVHDPGTLRDYPYRDDGLLVWEALRRYVRAYVAIYYRTDEEVGADAELEEWLDALRAPIEVGGFGVSSLPGKLRDRAALADLLTLIIFIAGPQHSAVAWTQYQNMAFVPNMPGALYKGGPTARGATERDLVAYLPGVDATLGQIRSIAIVGSKFDDKAFGDFGANAFVDSRAVEVHAKLRAQLAKIEERIEQRNEKRPDAYPGFLPSVMANSTSG